MEIISRLPVKKEVNPQPSQSFLEALARYQPRKRFWFPCLTAVFLAVLRQYVPSSDTDPNRNQIVFAANCVENVSSDQQTLEKGVIVYVDTGNYQAQPGGVVRSERQLGNGSIYYSHFPADLSKGAIRTQFVYEDEASTDDPSRHKVEKQTDYFGAPIALSSFYIDEVGGVKIEVQAESVDLSEKIVSDNIDPSTIGKHLGDITILPGSC